MMYLNLIIFIILLIFTAVFVATEFSIIRVRMSRVHQLVDENVKNARKLEKVVNNLDGYLSACQLGITITALGLGWLGEPTISRLLHPLLALFPMKAEVNTVISFALAFIIVTFLHVVLGELAPKTIAIVNSEKIALRLSPFIIWFNKLMFPFIWSLNGSANALVKLFGYQFVSEQNAHTEEEIRIILSDSYKSGNINQVEFGYMKNIFDFDTRLARDIMVPRTDMVCIFIDQMREETVEMIMEERYTRFPVAQGDKDNIIGILNTKSFLLLMFSEHAIEPNIKDIMQNVMAVPDTTPIRKLLQKMQLGQTHMAILLDEYGGTSGLVTIEDIIEEIVGEIRDEFDTDERSEIDLIDDNRYLVDGKALINDVNELTGLKLDNVETHTIGGWLYQLKPALEQDIEWKYEHVTFIVRERDENRIRSIEIIVEPQLSDISPVDHA